MPFFSKRAFARCVVRLIVALLTVSFAGSYRLRGQENTAAAWLRYAVPPDPPRYHDMPHAVVQLGNAPEEHTAAEELDRGLGHMVAGTDHLLRRFDPRVDAIVLGTPDALRRVRPRMLVDGRDAALPEDAYRIRHVRNGMRQWWVLEGGSPRAELYAAFRFSALVAEDRQLPELLNETARVPLRAIDLRGDLSILAKEDRTALVRWMASVGLNGLVVDGDGGVAPESVVAAARLYGVRVWFRGVAADAVAGLPGAGGVVLTASADAKQLAGDVAKADAAAHTLRKGDSSVLLENAFESLWQANAALDARAAVLRTAEPNVVLVNDAMSATQPLAGLAASYFGLLPGAAQIADFRLFPGEDRLAAFPVAIWQRALATPERGVREDSSLGEVVSRHAGSGAAGVMASLTVAQWVAMRGQPLLQANLFGFGRVAWNAAETSADIADAWARQTFGDDARVFGVAKNILLASADAFVNVSSPFGLAWLGDGARPDPARAAHRGASVPFATAGGIGIDHASEVQGYPAAFAAQLANEAQCPEDWLLALHRVAPDYRMRDGKTVAQAFYDAHFSGAAQMTNAVDAWEETRGLVDVERYTAVHDFLATAARRGGIWRDSTTEWMERTTGVMDALHFVGGHPGRVEAERMTLAGYVVAHSAEPEDASGGAYIACAAATVCSGETVFGGEANVYRVEIGYYDTAKPDSVLELLVNGVSQARWPVEVAPGEPTSATAERFVVNGVRLKEGDRITVAGRTAIDFADVTRDPRWN